MGRLLAGGLVASLAVVGSALVPAGAQTNPPTAPVGPNVNSFGFTVRPYTNPGSPARDVLEYQLPAGQQANDRVSVANLTDQPKTFFLYASDAYNTSAGGLALRLKSDAAKDAGGWVKLPVASYTIPPKSAALVPITVDVPADATPGDHTAGIVAEEQVPRSTVAESGGIQPIHRVATRVFVRVQGPITPSLQVQQVTITHSDPRIPFFGTGSAKVTYTIANTGNIRIKLDDIAVKVKGPLGWTVKSFIQRNEPVGTLPDQLLPGNTVVYSQAMGAVTPLLLMNATASVTGQDPLKQAPVAASASVLFWVVPWLLLLIVLVAVLVWLALRWWRKRRAARLDGTDPDGDGSGADPEGAGPGPDAALATATGFDETIARLRDPGVAR